MIYNEKSQSPDQHLSAREKANQLIQRIFSRFTGQTSEEEIDEMKGRVSVECMWSKDLPQEWANFSYDDLVELLDEIITMLDIKPEHRERITVLFGDHIETLFKNGNTHINSAYCLTDSDDNDHILGCRVVLNRSRELATYMIAKNNEMKSKEKRETEEINCILEEPWELIVWLMAEECDHAKLELLAGSKKQMALWQKRYETYRGKKHFQSSRSYDDQLSELTASRIVMRVLKRIAQKKNPSRIPYYQKLYKLSLETGKSISLIVGNVVDSAYVDTGFVPNKDLVE
jgi:hypothetical protein